MGQYHYLVNLDQKQFVHPHQIGNGFKLREQVGWSFATATALVMLLAASNRNGPRGGGDFRTAHPLVGAWAGDRVAFIGDYAEAGDLPDGEAARIYEYCDQVVKAGTTSNGWSNISAQVREMMSAEFGIQYQGSGWLDIVSGADITAKPPLAPDLGLRSGT